MVTCFLEIDTFKPDLVVFDIRLPDEDGDDYICVRQYSYCAVHGC